MSAGYVIAQLKVTKPKNYKEYVAKVTEEEKKAVLENTKHYQNNWKKYSKSIF